MRGKIGSGGIACIVGVAMTVPVLAALCLSAWWRARTGEVAFEFEKHVIELGDVAKDSTYDLEVPYRNAGSQPGNISEVITSCGCITTSGPHRVVMPGDSDVLQLQVSTSGVSPPEDIVKAVTVHVGGQAGPPIRLTVHGRAVPDVDFEPRQLHVLDPQRVGDEPSASRLVVSRGIISPEAFLVASWKESPSYYQIGELTRSSDKLECEVRLAEGPAPAVLRPLVFSVPIRGNITRITIPVEYNDEAMSVEARPRGYFRTVSAGADSHSLATNSRQVFRLIDRLGDSNGEDPRIISVEPQDSGGSRWLAWRIEPADGFDQLVVWVSHLPTEPVVTASLRVDYQHRGGDKGSTRIPVRVVALTDVPAETVAASAPPNGSLNH